MPNAALLQLLLGFVRPPATASSMLRSLWLLLHALFGRFALLLGGINVFIGIFLLGFLYEGEQFQCNRPAIMLMVYIKPPVPAISVTTDGDFDVSRFVVTANPCWYQAVLMFRYSRHFVGTVTRCWQ